MNIFKLWTRPRKAYQRPADPTPGGGQGILGLANVRKTKLCFDLFRTGFRSSENPPPFSAEVKKRVELYHYCPSGPSWPVLG